MMNCEKAKPLLTQYLLDDLDERMDADIWTHLKSCTRCRASARELEPTLNLLQGALAATQPAVDTLSPERRARVFASHRSPAGRILKWYSDQRVSMNSVAAVLVLCFVLSFLAIPATDHLFTAASPERFKLGDVVSSGPVEAELSAESMNNLQQIENSPQMWSLGLDADEPRPTTDSSVMPDDVTAVPKVASPMIMDHRRTGSTPVNEDLGRRLEGRDGERREAEKPAFAELDPMPESAPVSNFGKTSEKASVSALSSRKQNGTRALTPIAPQSATTRGFGGGLPKMPDPVGNPPANDSKPGNGSDKWFAVNGRVTGLPVRGELSLDEVSAGEKRDAASNAPGKPRPTSERDKPLVQGKPAEKKIHVVRPMKKKKKMDSRVDAVATPPGDSTRARETITTFFSDADDRDGRDKGGEFLGDVSGLQFRASSPKAAAKKNYKGGGKPVESFESLEKSRVVVSGGNVISGKLGRGGASAAHKSAAIAAAPMAAPESTVAWARSSKKDKERAAPVLDGKKSSGGIPILGRLFSSKKSKQASDSTVATDGYYSSELAVDGTEVRHSGFVSGSEDHDASKGWIKNASGSETFYRRVPDRSIEMSDKLVEAVEFGSVTLDDWEGLENQEANIAVGGKTYGWEKEDVGLDGGRARPVLTPDTLAVIPKEVTPSDQSAPRARFLTKAASSEFATKALEERTIGEQGPGGGTSYERGKDARGSGDNELKGLKDVKKESERLNGQFGFAEKMQDQREKFDEKSVEDGGFDNGVAMLRDSIDDENVPQRITKRLPEEVDRIQSTSGSIALKQNIAEPLRSEELVVRELAKVQSVMPENKKVLLSRGEYTVKPGDTLSEIARKSGVSINDLVGANDIKDANSIQVGQSLQMPDDGEMAVERDRPTGLSAVVRSLSEVEEALVDLSDDVEDQAGKEVLGGTTYATYWTDDVTVITKGPVSAEEMRQLVDTDGDGLATDYGYDARLALDSLDSIEELDGTQLELEATRLAAFGPKLDESRRQFEITARSGKKGEELDRWKAGLEKDERAFANRQNEVLKRLKTVNESKLKEMSPDGPTFKAVGVNPFVTTKENAFSTFAIDVDTASYTLARNYMSRGLLPAAESVRTEEFVNFFDYGYRAPKQKTFSVHLEVAETPFGRGLHALKVGVKGKHIGREQKRQAILTFAIDTSGSMNTADRLGLVQKSLEMLLDQLAPSDQIAIIQYNDHARLVLPHTEVKDRKAILAAIHGMQTSGSTNLEEGMGLAYETAARGFDSKAFNRVMLLSDGVANLGAGDADSILQSVEGYRKQGIYCSTVGFGIGSYDDSMLETLANKGDGTYVFIDSEKEARRVFVEELSATLNVIASDVKIQVEFNKDRVERYRQLGYENRQLTKQQFRDDTVDAGEVGSGQSVTALYEMELIGQRRDDLGIVRVRYRNTDTGDVEEETFPITPDMLRGAFKKSSDRFQLAVGVAEYAEILRNNPHAQGSSFNDVSRVLAPVGLNLHLDGRVQELIRLVQVSGGLSRTAE